MNLIAFVVAPVNECRYKLFNYLPVDVGVLVYWMLPRPQSACVRQLRKFVLVVGCCRVLSVRSSV